MPQTSPMNWALISTAPLVLNLIFNSKKLKHSIKMNGKDKWKMKNIKIWKW